MRSSFYLWFLTNTASRLGSIPRFNINSTLGLDQEIEAVSIWLHYLRSLLLVATCHGMSWHALGFFILFVWRLFSFRYLAHR